MYEKLYNDDAYAREFISDVVSVKESVYENESVYDFVLEKTCFFPEQGGQTSDTGELFDINSNTVLDVIHVYIKDDTVHHLVRIHKDEESEELNKRKSRVKRNEAAEEGPVLPVGIQRVHGMINWEERFDKMQNHSGEHLVSGTVHRFFGYDNVGFSLSADNVTLDFNGKFTDENIAFIEKTVNRAVFENFKVVISTPSEEELKKIDYRSKKELTGPVRIVEFPGYDICACCAPHVASTGEIGIIKIVSAEHFKGGTRMVIRCGYRALKDYGTKMSSVKQISQLLSVPVDEVSDATVKLNDEVKTLKFEVSDIAKTMLDLKVENARKEDMPLVFDEKADMNAARKTISEMMASSGDLFGIFLGDDKNGYGFCIGSNKQDCKKLMVFLKAIFGAKGGGSETMIQGNVNADQNSIRKMLKKYIDDPDIVTMIENEKETKKIGYKGNEA